MDATPSRRPKQVCNSVSLSAARTLHPGNRFA
jgi:hypothetical protein